MTYSTRNLNFALPLPITQTAQANAQSLAHQQSSPEKAEQVRLNTLAVQVVNDYLQLMGIATSWERSDVRDPIVQLFANVADLEIIGLGRLECRPIQTQEPTCYIPPEVWHDRIGYVVVEINEATQQAVMLGFSHTAEVEQLSLNRLQSPEALIDHLYTLSHPIPETSQLQPVVNLSQWFQNVFETGWQTIDSLLNPPELGFAYRSRSDDRFRSDASRDSLKRAKLIDLGLQLANRPLALTVELSQQTSEEIEVHLQLHPMSGQFLPPDLRLIVLDETGATFLEAQSRNADNYLQLQMSGSPGERFSVQVSLGQASVTEAFVI